MTKTFRNLVFLNIALGLSFIFIWYPLRIPNEYYELVSGFTNDYSPWMSASGRIIYHHSYVYYPVSYALQNLNFDIPFLYGVLNSLYLSGIGIFFEGLNVYFSTYPILCAFAICILSFILYSINPSASLLSTAFLYGLFALVGYTPLLIAASFAPSRYIGVAVQLLLIVLCGRSSRLVYLYLVTVFSILWNFEFGIIGAVGTAVYLSLNRNLTIVSRIAAAAGILIVAIAVKSIFEPTTLYLSTNFIGFFGIGVPVFDKLHLFFFLLIVAGFNTFFIANYRRYEHSAAVVCSILLIFDLILIKFVFNVSHPHLFYVLTLVVPFALTVFSKNSKNNLCNNRYVLLAALLFVCSTFYNFSSEKEQFNQLYGWKSDRESAFVDNQIDLSKFKLPREWVDPKKRYLVISPQDYLYYIENPKIKPLLHFELLTNIIADSDKSIISKSIESGTYIIIDKSITTICPAVIYSPDCKLKDDRKRFLYNLVTDLNYKLSKISDSGNLSLYIVN